MRAHLILFFVAVALIGKAQNSPPVKLSGAAALMFKNVKTKISDAVKNKIFQHLKVQLAADNTFVIEEYPVAVTVYPTDMNKDGEEEIFISMGSGALYGNTGEGFALFIKDKSGVYKQQDFSGSGRPTILTTAAAGCPDILIGGPGFEFAVYRWNGSQYTWHRSMKDSALTNSNSTDIEAYSKAYTK